jgi:hypothetical protein
MNFFDQKTGVVNLSGVFMEKAQDRLLQPMQKNLSNSRSTTGFDPTTAL